MIRIEGIERVAESVMSPAKQVTVQDLTTQEHDAFALLDAWMARSLANQQVSNAAAAAGRKHR